MKSIFNPKFTGILCLLLLVLPCKAFQVSPALTTVDQATETPRRYADVSITITSDEELSKLITLGLDVDHFHPAIGENRVVIPTEELPLLVGTGLTYKVYSKDLASDIEQRNIKDAAKYSGAQFEKAANGFELGSMGGFYTYAEVLQQLDEMYANYPQLITERFSIGTTGEGRTIWAVKISDNPTVDESSSEAPVYFDALHHAREPASMATVINFMFHLLENYAGDVRTEYIVNNREIFFVPVVNPDGYEYNRQTNPNGGGMWRKNRRVNSGTSCRGVDINRNYDTDWAGGGASSNPCSDTYYGTSPFSELESQAVRDFTTSINAPIAYTTHTSGGYWLGPDFSNGQQEYAIHAELASDCMHENEYIYGDANILLGYASGTTQNWMYEALGSISWTPEIGTTGFWPSIPEIFPLVSQQVGAYEYACWVAGALADYQGFTVTSSTGLSSGQDLELDVLIKNKGLSKSADNVVVSITTDNPGVTATLGSQSYGTIASRAFVTNGTPFSFSVDPSVAAGTLVEFTVVVTQDGVLSDEDVFQLTVGQPTVLFSDDAESGSSAWLNGGTGSTWQTSTSDAYTGNSCFVDSRLSHTNANNNRSFALGNAVSLAGTSNPRLEFAAKWGLHTTTDYVRLQVSTNGGGSWANLATPAMETINNAPAFKENESWTYQVADLSPYIGQSIRVRFVSVSNSGLRSDGFYFDDFRIVEYSSGPAVPTCFDGIQNGDETDVDCGGSCAPCTTGCTPLTITSDDFEGGLGNWIDGGTDCFLLDNASYSNSGTKSVVLRDNTSTSVLTSNNLDLSAYSELSVDFSYFPLSMDNASEDFWLQVSTDGGASYTIVEEWNQGDEFENSTRYFESVTVNGPFTANTRIRFRCDASADADYIILDDIVLSVCDGGTAAPTCTDGIQNGSETGIDCGGPDCNPCFTCTDGIQNGSETGVDCGGPDCAACETCTDGIQNGSETDIDCGGPDCAPCETCTDGIQNGSETGVDCGGPDCAACETCTDGIQNGSETDIDCGGPDCAACETCTDGIQNGSETGVDCGGPDCAPCETCTDGIQNGSETGVDCGGPDCAACETCTDGIQNGSETGVDCGGPDCGACPVNYCNSRGNSTQYEFIQSVTLAGTTNNSGNNSGYADFTGSTPIALGSGTATVSLTPGFNGGAYTEGWVVYVDYNADGDFTDAGERVLQLAGSSTVSGSFTVPAGLTGTSRMRIQMQYNAYTGGSCDTYSWGEVEDYSVDFGGNSLRNISGNEFRPVNTEARLFPNPAIDQISIILPEGADLNGWHWTVSDASGRLIRRSLTPVTGQFEVEVSDLQNGIYVMSLYTENRVVVKRFIVHGH